MSAWPHVPLDLQGHRGARGLAPESTIASFDAAIAHGVTGIEFDVRLTGDGEVVVWHDPTLEAAKCVFEGEDLTEALVADLTLAQLRSVDVGSRTLAAYPQQVAAPGSRILTLAELFDRYAAAHPTLWWTVEVKVDPTDPRERATRNALLDGVLATVTQAGVRERAFIHSFDWAVLERSREIDPQLPRSALAVVGQTFAPGSQWLGSVRWEDHPDDLAGAAAELGAVVVSPDFPSCTTDLVERCHAGGIAVLPWTVNDPVVFGRLAAAGVDGLVTDVPDEMLAL